MRELLLEFDSLSDYMRDKGKISLNYRGYKVISVGKRSDTDKVIVRLEKLREKMHEAIDIYGIGSVEALEISKQLDELVVAEQKERLNIL